MSLPMNGTYSLTWREHCSSLATTIQIFRCRNYLVDCTLVAEGRRFPANKIVLGAASPFLLNLLKNTPCTNPVIILVGVNAKDLEALLEFIYNGKVNVDQTQLPSLLQTAQCLDIKALAIKMEMQPITFQQCHDQNPSTPTTTHTAGTDVEQQTSEQQQQLQAQQGFGNNSDGQHLLTSKIVTMHPEFTPIPKNTSVDECADASSSVTRNTVKRALHSPSNLPINCPICFVVIRQSRNLRRHVQLKHLGNFALKKTTDQTKTETLATGTDSGTTITTRTSMITATLPTRPHVISMCSLPNLHTLEVKKDLHAQTHGQTLAFTSTGGIQQQQQQDFQQQIHHQVIDLSNNITTAATTGCKQQQMTGRQIVTQTEITHGNTTAMENINQAKRNYYDNGIVADVSNTLVHFKRLP